MNSKTKILLLSGDPVGGIRKHIVDIIFSLDSFFDFHYISSDVFDKNFENRYDELLELAKHLPLFIPKKPSIHDVKNIFIICNYIKKNNIKVVHGHGAKGGMYARVAGKIAGVKVIYTPHGGVVHSMFSPIEDFLYRTIEFSLSFFTDILLFESEYSKKSFNNRFGKRGCKKQIVNYNGVYIPEKLTKPKPEQKREVSKKICFLGCLREEKGILLAIKSIEKLLFKGHDIEFHVYGEGGLKEQLVTFIQDKDLKNRVFLHGETNKPYETMKSHDFILMPSLFESFGYVAIESMLLRIPLIVSDAGALSEVCKGAKVYQFKHNSIEAMVSEIENVLSLSDKDIFDNLEYSYDFASLNYNIEDMSSELKSVYQGLS